MAAQSEISWPPKSPLQALLSSPSGRSKYNRLADAGKSSPVRRQLFPSRGDVSQTTAFPEACHEDDDDDEETLQLKLQAIEARLKLKQLQTRKAATVTGQTSASLAPAPILLSTNTAQSVKEPDCVPQVPASPIRRNRASAVHPESPIRSLIGLTNGLSGKNVSLRPLPASRDRQASSGLAASREGKSHAVPPINREKHSGFSARLSSTRQIQDAQTQRSVQLDRLAQSRSTRFERAHVQPRISEDAGTEVSIRESGEEATVKSRSSKPSRAPSVRKFTDSGHSAVDAESFSQVILSNRVLPQSFVDRTIEDKMPVTLPTLLRDVKKPHFELPDNLSDGDLVVFGILASKSAPLDHKFGERIKIDKGESTSRTEAEESKKNDHGKYMVLALTDFEWTVDLYLFGEAFTRWRKLIPGTLIAILNPTILPPRKDKIHTNKWSLSLRFGDDTVLEIGTARDLGWCKSVKKDGRQCSSWVCLSKTEFCDFHVNANIDRIKSKRMEFSGMGLPFGPGGRKKGKREGKDKTQVGRQYDKDTGSEYYVVPAYTRNATALLDADDFMASRGNKDDKSRQILADREGEKRMASKLAKLGDRAGADYMRKTSTTASSAKPHGKVDVSQPLTRGALELGSGVRSADVRLSPLKRKRETISEISSKRTRFITPNGIREPGRSSFGERANEAGSTSPGGEDDLEIV